MVLSGVGGVFRMLNSEFGEVVPLDFDGSPFHDKIRSGLEFREIPTACGENLAAP